MIKTIRLSILIISVVTSIISLGCIYKEEFVSETGKFVKKSEKGIFNDLEIITELEKTVFKEGERINVLFILKNNGNNLVHLNDKGFDAGIYDTNGYLVTYIRGNRETSKPVNLGKDTSFIESLDWYQTYRDDDNNKYLEPGKYYLTGYLIADATYNDENGEHIIEPYTIKTEPMEIVIE